MQTELDKVLNVLLEGGYDVEDPYQAAIGLQAELDEARRHVMDLERRQIIAMDRLCGQLAIAIRRHQPSLSINLIAGTCRVGYRSKSLTIKPSLHDRLWQVSSADPSFSRRFMRLSGPRTNLDGDVEPLAQAIAVFFKEHYRSLHEEMFGHGAVLIEGRRSSMSDVVALINQTDMEACQ